MRGYLSREYAEALPHLGDPIRLEAAGTWLLGRRIPGSDCVDAVGPYPILCCRSWDRLHDELAALAGPISVTGVADPFGEHTPQLLEKAFPDLMQEYKPHYYVDLRNPQIDPHHRRNIKKANAAVSVVEGLPEASDWVELYRNLAARHGVQGPADFPEESLRKQLGVPDLIGLSALEDGATVGCILWFDHGPVAYYHLAAYSDRGYDLRASFALFAASIEYFQKKGTRYLSLGAGAGINADPNDGLNRFKAGWANGTRMAYLCGAVLDIAEYRRLSAGKATTYFPAYRAP